MILVLLDTGVRLSELSEMKLADVKAGRSPHPWGIAVDGKTGKRRVAVAKDATMALHWYLQVRARHPRGRNARRRSRA